MKDKKIKYSGIRRNIGQYVSAANRIPVIRETIAINIEGLREFCSQNKVTYTPVFMKVIAALQEKYPIVNSYVARDITLQKKIFLSDSVDLALAIEKIEDGVSFATISVIRNVDKKSISKLGAEIMKLSDMPYRDMPDGRIRRLLEFCPDFLKYILIRLTIQFPFFFKHFHGTIGMSNLGKFGIKSFDTLFVNNFAYAIGGIEQVPIVKNGELRVVSCLNITQTSNHRFVDGAESARILAELKRMIESGDYIAICEA